MIKKYAVFAASGYWQVAVCIALWGWSMLVFPLGGILGTGTLGMFALLYGIQRSLLVVVLSSVALAALLLLTNQLLLPAGDPISIQRSVILMVFQWLPMLAIVLLFTKTESLSLVFQALTGFFILLVLGMELLLDDSTVFWGRFIEQATGADIQRLLNANPDLQPQYEAMLALMTGFMSSSMLVVWGTSLLLANWLQSLVNASGTFASMFTGIKLGKVISGLGLILFVVSALTQSALALQLVIVIFAVAVFQGIATVHFLLRNVANGKLFLWLFYGALILSPLLPLFPLLLGIGGIMESFVNLRDRSMADRSE